ncbi:protein MIZU-KUSSEI 1-like [Solanum tuberosum]|uniref:Protein MIZU-KUSSEI 1 n=1 Tax=Solanum tuberosum TaxID=4113 RepID=M1BEB9_SOLTU|nr:PREDICTED: protein MIZU-KUSSEI 1-like [Solanum tuberosum]
MITSYPTTTSPITSVDCEKQVRSWRFLRSLMKLLIPRCNCIFIEEENDNRKHIPYFKHNSSSSSSAITITGTIFGSRKGKVNFCIQSNPNSTNPILLLELAVSTSSLASEMQKGVVRIALESKTNDSSSSSASFLSMPIWRMYCNGKKVGFAVKRKPAKVDLQVLRQMESVIVGAGIIHGKKGVIKNDNDDDDIMYLRGKFERVHGSNDSESFHLVDPEENMGQELSIFFLRSLN